MSQIHSLDAAGNNPSIPTSFHTDSGVAVPLANALNILGGTGISTSGSGNTVSIAFTGGSSLVSSIQGTAPITANGVSGVPQTGAVTIALTTPLGVTFGGTGTSTQFTQGSVVFAGVSGIYNQNNSEFFWDTTNAALGIGTNTPATGNSSKLKVRVNSSTFSQAINLTGTISASSGVTSGVYNAMTYAPTVGGVSSGFTCDVNLQLPAATSMALLCFEASPSFNTNAGSISSYGFYFDGGGPSSGTITAQYGAYLNSPIAGTIKMGLWSGEGMIGNSYNMTNPPTNGLCVQGQVGLGTSSPLSVAQLTISTTNAYNIYTQGTQTTVDGGTSNYSIIANSTLNPTNGSTISGGIYSGCSYIAPSTKTISNAYGNYIYNTTNANVGTITRLAGIFVDTGSAGTGTITTAYGGYFSTPAAGSTKIAFYSDNGSIGYATTTPPTNGLIISGQTGIGTNTISGSSEQLAITKAAGGYLVKWSDGTIVGGLGTSSSQSAAFVNTFSNHALVFATNNAAAQAWLTTSGNFGIGSTSPVSKLGVITSNDNSDGQPTAFDNRFMTVGQGGANGSNVFISMDATGTTPRGFIGSLAAGVTWLPLILQPAALGGVGIGLATLAPKNLLDVGGNVAIGAYAGVNSAPTNGLIVSGATAIGNSSNTLARFLVSMATSDIRGIRLDGSSTATGNNLVGIQINPSLQTSSNSFSAFGITAQPAISTTSNVANAFGAYIQVSTTGSGTINNIYGLQIDTPTASSGTPTVTSTYGLMINSQALATSNYAASLQGGIVYKYNGQSSSYNVNTNDYIVAINNTAAARTVTLPATVPPAGWFIIIKDESGGAGTNNITISGNGHNIDGASTATINANYGALQIYSNGSNYFIT